MTAQVRSITLHASAAETATGNSADTPEIPSDGPGVAYLDVTASAGTAPTLDVTIEALDVLSGKHFVIATFAQKVTTGVERITTGLVDLPDAVLRAVWTITGSAGQSFTFTVGLVLKDRG